MATTRMERAGRARMLWVLAVRVAQTGRVEAAMASMTETQMQGWGCWERGSAYNEMLRGNAEVVQQQGKVSTAPVVFQALP